MMNYIIKRDGTRELFNEDKIVNAIKKSMIEADSLDVVTMHDIAHQIGQLIINNNEVEFTVEEIEAFMKKGE